MSDLTGRAEILPELYRVFCGDYTEQIQLLITGKDKSGKTVDLTRVPVSYATVIEKRLKAPIDVIERWSQSISTGDGSICGQQGDHLLVLDCQLLREMPKPVYDGAIVLSRQIWGELRLERGNTLYLSAEDVKKVHNQGYGWRRGRFCATNKEVERVYDFLTRGKNTSEYVKFVKQSWLDSHFRAVDEMSWQGSIDYVQKRIEEAESEIILDISLNSTLTRSGKPTLRPLVAKFLSCTTEKSGSMLVGVAPELQVLVERILQQ